MRKLVRRALLRKFARHSVSAKQAHRTYTSGPTPPPKARTHTEASSWRSTSRRQQNHSQWCSIRGIIPFSRNLRSKIWRKGNFYGVSEASNGQLHARLLAANVKKKKTEGKVRTFRHKKPCEKEMKKLKTSSSTCSECPKKNTEGSAITDLPEKSVS